MAARIDSASSYGPRQASMVLIRSETFAVFAMCVAIQSFFSFSRFGTRDGLLDGFGDDVSHTVPILCFFLCTSRGACQSERTIHTVAAYCRSHATSGGCPCVVVFCLLSGHGDVSVSHQLLKMKTAAVQISPCRTRHVHTQVT